VSFYHESKRTFVKVAKIIIVAVNKVVSLNKVDDAMSPSFTYSAYGATALLVTH
jgi:hypothetical protein